MRPADTLKTSADLKAGESPADQALSLDLTALIEVSPDVRIMCFYHAESGFFHPRRLLCTSPAQATQRAPAGYVPLEAFDLNPLTQRVDVRTGRIINMDSQDMRRVAAVRKIQELESRGLRAMREHLLDKPGARERLNSLDEQIGELRQVISGLS